MMECVSVAILLKIEGVESMRYIVYYQNIFVK